MNKDKKEQKNPAWQQKPQHNPSAPNQNVPKNPSYQTPGKKPHGGCGC
jgi:hypothetical protein